MEKIDEDLNNESWVLEDVVSEGSGSGKYDIRI